MRVILSFVFGLSLLVSSASHAITLKISTLYPDGTSAVTALKKAGKTIAEQTQGRVDLKVYAGGTMGDDKTVQRKIRIGQLHGALTQSGALASVYPDSQVYNLPLVFRDYDEVDYVRSELDSEIAKQFEAKGWKTFGFVDGGFGYLMTQKPVASVEDFQLQKLWLPSTDTGSAAAAKAFELSPVLLPISSVLTSLQTGSIDSFVAPPVAALTLQWFTRANYVTDMPLLYTYGLLAVSTKYFSQMSKDDQAIVDKVLGEAFAKLNAESREQNKDAFNALLSQGIKEVVPTDEQLVIWRDYAQKARHILAEDGQVSQAMQNKLDELLKQYRDAH